MQFHHSIYINWKQIKRKRRAHLFSAQWRWIFIITWKRCWHTVRYHSHIRDISGGQKGFNIHFLTSPFVLVSAVLSTFCRRTLRTDLLLKRQKWHHLCLIYSFSLQPDIKTKLADTYLRQTFCSGVLQQQLSASVWIGGISLFVTGTFKNNTCRIRFSMTDRWPAAEQMHKKTQSDWWL